MERVQQFVVNNQVYERDYEDGLAPGYRFCPTDAELIVYYLKAKIEKDEHPPCRIHEVNIYNYSPEDLARYRSCDNKRYFLTSRERMCPNGSRPNRKAGNFGKWKAAQKATKVYDVNGEDVGWKRSLCFLDEYGIKTSWLMHEYTTEDPNLPIGTGPQTMLSNCVLCKIYKKETKERNGTGSVNQAKQVVRLRNEYDQEEEEQNQLLHTDDEPSPKRTRLSDNQLLQGASTSTSTNYDQSSSNYEGILLTDGYYQQQNQPMSFTATNNSIIRVSADGASTSTTNDQLPVAAVDDQQTPSNMIVATPPSFAETSLPLDMFCDGPWGIPGDIYLPADGSCQADDFEDFGLYLEQLLSPVH